MNTQDLFDTHEPRRRARIGMERVSQAVEKECPGWMDIALDAIRRFAGGNPGTFTAERMRTVLEPELPPTDRLRIWGPLVQAAIRKGYIRPTKGYAPAASSNGSPKRLYSRGANA